MIPASLHNHSEYSLLDCAMRLKDMVKAARAFGMPAVGITDRNSIAGAVAFFRECLSHEPKVHPVLGCELVLQGGYPIVLLAKNDEGYANLCDLLSRTTDEFIPITLHRLKQCSAGLICLSGGHDAEIPRQLKLGQTVLADRLANAFAEIFPGRCYIELTYHQRADSVQCGRLHQLAQRTGLPMVAASNSRYLRPADQRAHQALASIRTLTLLDEAHPEKLHAETDGLHAFLSPRKMAQFFSAYPGALENTVTIAQRCRVHRLEAAV
jgi:DNA polymerase-3 subunit alpha